MKAISKQEVIQSMEKFVEENLSLLQPADKLWQPMDFLPRTDRDNWEAEIQRLQTNARNLSDELLLVLIGNMITEEALPSYETWLSGLDGIGGKNGISRNPWALWTRGWTAEENRHGAILNTYLYLSGRADMKSVFRTIYYLIQNGFDPQTGTDPYYGLVYTSFQERATTVAHRNTGRVALKQGDENLGQICSLVAGDESRHERAYKNFFQKVLELDPEGGVLAFAEMMKRKIIMPAKNMADAGEKELFIQHIVSAQRLGIYTANDYAEIIRHLLDFWQIDKLKSLGPEAAEAQEYLCGLPKFYEGKAHKLGLMAKLRPRMKCPWLYNRKV